MASTRKSPSAEYASDSVAALYERFAACAQPWLSQRIVAGFSGGLDSTVLLHLLYRLRTEQPFSLSAFHFHHGISANADAWLAHCATICEQWQLPFSFAKGGVRPIPGASLEALARDARRTAFAALDADVIALAHHREDQAETVMYRLARGCGVHGAAGMAASNPLDAAHRLWRPLLRESRATLLAYARQHGLRWIEDESNASLQFDRNFLRAEVFPVLASRFPQVADQFSRAAQRFAEAATLLDELAAADALCGVAAGSAPAAGDGQALPLASLRPLTRLRQLNVLRWFLARHAMNPSEKQLNLILDQLLTAREDTQPCLRLAEREVRRFRDAVYVTTRHLDPLPQTGACPEGAAWAPPGWAGCLSWERAVGGLDARYLHDLTLRPRSGGEVLRPRRGGPSRPVKHLFQEAAIPPWLRAQWPLLWQGERLLAIPGVAVHADVQAEDAAGYWPHWQPG